MSTTYQFGLFPCTTQPHYLYYLGSWLLTKLHPYHPNTTTIHSLNEELLADKECISLQYISHVPSEENTTPPKKITWHKKSTGRLYMNWNKIPPQSKSHRNWPMTTGINHKLLLKLPIFAPLSPTQQLCTQLTNKTSHTLKMIIKSNKHWQEQEILMKITTSKIVPIAQTLGIVQHPITKLIRSVELYIPHSMLGILHQDLISELSHTAFGLC